MEQSTPQLPSSVVRAAVRAFGVADVRTISRLHGGAGSSRKFVIERAPDAGNPRRLLLRCTPRSAGSVERFAARHDIARQLATLGVPVAVPLVDPKGGTVLADETTIFELVPFVEGEQWTPSPARARDAGRVLARLHAAAARIEPAALDRLRPPAGLLAGDGRRLLAETRGRTDDGTEAGFLRGTLAECVERVGDPEPGSLSISGLTHGLVHGDYHPGNMRFAGDAVAGIFDFDACRRGHPQEEAALASVHFSIDRGSKAMDARAPWPDTALFEAFWSGYLSEAGPRTADAHAVSAHSVPWIAAGAFALETLAGTNGEAFGDETVSFAAGVAAWLVEHASGLGEVVAQAGAAGS